MDLTLDYEKLNSEFELNKAVFGKSIIETIYLVENDKSIIAHQLTQEEMDMIGWVEKKEIDKIKDSYDLQKKFENKIKACDKVIKYLETLHNYLLKREQGGIV